MGFKPNVRRNIKIEKNLFEQIRQAFLPSRSLSNQFFAVRNVYHGSFGKRTAYFTSIKNNGALSLESQLELGHAIELERLNSIIAYRAQATKIELGNNTYAFPDFLILNNLKQYELHEVKECLDSLSDEQIEKFNQIKKYLNRLDIEYKLFDHRNIPTQRQRQRLLAMYQSIRMHQLSKERIEVAKEIPFPNRMPLDHLYSYFGNYDYSYEDLNYLLFYNHIGKNNVREINILEKSNG
jgi:hypothetical protein